MPDRRNLLSPSVFPGQFVPAGKDSPLMRASMRDCKVRVIFAGKNEKVNRTPIAEGWTRLTMRAADGGLIQCFFQQKPWNYRSCCALVQRLKMMTRGGLAGRGMPRTIVVSSCPSDKIRHILPHGRGSPGGDQRGRVTNVTKHRRKRHGMGLALCAGMLGISLGMTIPCARSKSGKKTQVRMLRTQDSGLRTQDSGTDNCRLLTDN